MDEKAKQYIEDMQKKGFTQQQIDEQLKKSGYTSEQTGKVDSAQPELDLDTDSSFKDKVFDWVGDHKKILLIVGIALGVIILLGIGLMIMRNMNAQGEILTEPPITTTDGENYPEGGAANAQENTPQDENSTPTASLNDLGGTPTCGSCQFLENNKCVAYECCNDDDCPFIDTCVDHECVMVECDCGSLIEHGCQPYNCCNDDDCVGDQTCFHDNTSMSECRLTSGGGDEEAQVECSVDSDCDDSKATTKDTCEGLPLVCEHEIILQCLDDDDFCPSYCRYNNDNDCESLASMYDEPNDIPACGDFDCFLDAAQFCDISSVTIDKTFTTQLGVEQHTTAQLALWGVQEGKCVYYQHQQEISFTFDEEALANQGLSPIDIQLLKATLNAQSLEGETLCAVEEGIALELVIAYEDGGSIPANLFDEFGCERI